MKFILGGNTKGVYKNLIAYIKQLDFSKKWSIEIKLHKASRSLEQNALYWIWVACFCEHLGYTKEEMHEVLATEYLPPIAFEFHGVMYERRTSTTKLSVNQFAEYLQHIEVLSSELQVNLPHPDDRYYLALHGAKNGR